MHSKFSNAAASALLRLCLVALLCASLSPAWGQRFSSKSGKAAFTSDAPLEVIQASTDKVGCTIDITTRQFAFSVNMQSFQGFNSALQRQHFNENYVESDKYPKGTFAGKIIEEVDLSVPGTYTVRAKGKLTIHGVEVERIIRSTIVVGPRTIEVKAKFEVPLTDHRITIPRIVNRKIAEVIDVKFDASLKP